MQVHIEVTKQVTLVLSEQKADWLHGAMQNSLTGDYETIPDNSMRTAFFNATHIPKEK